MTPEQLIARKRTIGASEAAAACGLSPWKTPLELWQDKTSNVLIDADSAAMEWGRRLESVVLDKYIEDTGRAVERHCTTRTSSEYPFMSCTPDALAVDRVVEVKTAGLAKAAEWGEPGTDAVPLHYLIQVMHQMVVTGLRKADIPVLIAGHDYRCYTVEFDEALAGLLIAREREFWQHVQDGTPPDVKTLKDANIRWPKDSGVTAIASMEVAAAVVQLREVNEKISALEGDADALQLAIKTCMAEASALTDSAGHVLATWKTQGRTQFAYAAFKLAHPDLYAEYNVQQSTRVFRLAKGK